MSSLETPLHTRMISVRLAWGEARRLRVAGRIFDLRKRGIVPLPGTLQGPGVVHDMAVELECDVGDLRIRRIAPSMSAFPFTAGPTTRGEGCPDRLPDAQQLIGRSLQENYGPTLMETVGGPRGCFHVFTLLRLIGPTVEMAVARVRSGGDNVGTAPGSPIFARSVIVDGFKGEGLSITLRGTLCDLHYLLADDGSHAQDLETASEAIADLAVEIPAMLIARCSGRVRHRGPGLAAVGEWETVATVERLRGRPIQKGYTAEVQELFAGSQGLEPLQHVLFMMAPAMIQCFPSLVEELEMRPRQAERPHAAVNSCHMWRADGPLVKDLRF